MVRGPDSADDAARAEFRAGFEDRTIVADFAIDDSADFNVMEFELACGERGPGFAERCRLARQVLIGLAANRMGIKAGVIIAARPAISIS